MLADGAALFVRPVRMSDQESLQRLFYSLSDQSVYQRFLAHKSVHSDIEMRRLVDADYAASVGLVVCEPSANEVVAMARYDVDPGTGLADIAFVVRDEWQRRGIGTGLMRRMLEIGQSKGLAGLTADVLASNPGMLMVFQRSGLNVQSKFEDGVHHLIMRLDDKAA